MLSVKSVKKFVVCDVFFLSVWKVHAQHLLLIFINEENLFQNKRLYLFFIGTNIQLNTYPLSPSVIYCMILDTAAHRRGAPPVSGVASEHRRKPLGTQLPLSDSQLPRVVHLRGRSR